MAEFSSLNGYNVKDATARASATALSASKATMEQTLSSLTTRVTALENAGPSVVTPTTSYDGATETLTITFAATYDEGSESLTM